MENKTNSRSGAANSKSNYRNKAAASSGNSSRTTDNAANYTVQTSYQLYQSNRSNGIQQPRDSNNSQQIQRSQQSQQTDHSDRSNNSHHSNHSHHSHHSHHTHHSHHSSHSSSGSKGSSKDGSRKRRRYTKRYEFNTTVILIFASVAVLVIVAIAVLISQISLVKEHSDESETTEDTVLVAEGEELQEQMDDMFSEHEKYSLVNHEVKPDRDFPLLKVYNGKGQLLIAPMRKTDGTIEGTKTFEYDVEGNLIIEREYSPAGYLVCKDVLGGKDEGTARTVYETEFNTKGAYSGYTETLFNSEGIEIEKIQCSSNGVVEGKYDYVYNEDGTVSRENRYTPYGELSVYSEYKYDHLGNITEKVQYDATGKEVLRDTMTYDGNGRITLEQHYTLGICKSYVEYIYDENGVATVKKYSLVDEYNMKYEEVR